MTKRKFSNVSFDDDDDEDIKPKSSPPVRKPVSKRIKFETLPEIKSLIDLINIGKSSKFYKNIDVLMLWDILPYLIELDNMIGMDGVKESVFYQVIYYLQGLHSRSEGDYLHTIITGLPGSGKTTVAKIIGKILTNLGVLSRHGKFKVATRPDLVDQYLGGTAIKTKKLLTSCIGGVLFVDEVYSLGSGNKDRVDSFSKECVDTINEFLSDHKNDFCMIVAGYRAEIDKCFLSLNPGLARRFQWCHNIEGYSEDNLGDILLKMIKEINWEVNISKEDIVKIIIENKNLFLDGGGSCENLITKIKLMHSRRVFGLEPNVKYIITTEDLNNAIQMIKKYSKPKETIHYNMYT